MRVWFLIQMFENLMREEGREAVIKNDNNFVASHR